MRAPSPKTRRAAFAALVIAAAAALILGARGPDEDDPPLSSGMLVIRHGSLSGGWHSPSLRMSLLTDSEVFGWQPRRALSTRSRKERNATDRAAFLQSLKIGDFVVHVEHGIAQYEGLTRLEASGAEREGTRVVVHHPASSPGATISSPR